MKRKTDLQLSEDETSNVLCKRLKLTAPETQDRFREPIGQSTDEDEIVDIKEKLSTANKYIEGEITIIKNKFLTIFSGRFDRDPVLKSEVCGVR